MKDNDKMIIMEPGEHEMRKAFEQVTTQNVKTVIDYSTDTRDMLRKTQEEFTQLKNMLVTRDAEIAALKQQVSIIQGKLYSGGSE